MSSGEGEGGVRNTPENRGVTGGERGTGPRHQGGPAAPGPRDRGDAWWLMRGPGTGCSDARAFHFGCLVFPTGLERPVPGICPVRAAPVSRGRSGTPGRAGGPAGRCKSRATAYGPALIPGVIRCGFSDRCGRARASPDRKPEKSAETGLLRNNQQRNGAGSSPGKKAATVWTEPIFSGLSIYFN